MFCVIDGCCFTCNKVTHVSKKGKVIKCNAKEDEGYYREIGCGYCGDKCKFKSKGNPYVRTISIRV